MLTKMGVEAEIQGKLLLIFKTIFKNKQTKTERDIKVNVQTLSPLSNPFPCKSFTDVR